jgi:hypothetical protein
MANYTEFGSAAKVAMIQKKYDLTKLALEVGICVPYLCEIFCGTRKGKKQIPKIKKILGI